MDHFELVERQATRESNARTYPRSMPVAIGRASGCEIFDVDGKRYLDCFAGAGVLALGHGHPRVVEAVQKQLGQLVHALDLPTPARDAFVTELLSTLPTSMQGKMRVHVCAPTGSDAIEAAIKLCKRATKRSGVLAFQGGYHGMTAGALAVTSLRGVKERIPSLMPEVSFSPYAYCLRCPMKLTPDHCRTACASALETTLEDDHSGVTLPALAIMEMVQGEGGSIVPPRAFVERVREATRASGVPLVADEVQAGLCRTGRFWAFEHFDITPDVIATSKALGGIGLPIAAIVYREDLDVWEPGTHIGTFRGHQLAMAAGTAAIRVMREERLAERAEARGAQLLRGLREIDSPAIAEVRGLGLMIGVELAHPETKKPLPAFAKRVRAECFARGMLCELGGRGDSTVRFLPPLVISEAQIDEAISIFGDAIRSAERTS